VRVEEFVYGDRSRERFDIVWPKDKPLGLAVFVHGGYWMRLDKSYWTNLAEGARSQGWAVCIPSYSLAPEVSISTITTQITAAISEASTIVAGPIRLAGHSAGGHLVTRMLCIDSALNVDVSRRIEHSLTISGLHDLRPLLYTTMNDTLQLDINEAVSESPALQLPNANVELTAWVGGNELSEFIRQAKLISLMWDGLDVTTKCVVEAEHNHFSVIEALADQNSAITRAFCG